MTGTGVIEPVIAHDKVFVELSLPQRSVAGEGFSIIKSSW
jgi:hypothetical protein